MLRSNTTKVAVRPRSTVCGGGKVTNRMPGSRTTGAGPGGFGAGGVGDGGGGVATGPGGFGAGGSGDSAGPGGFGAGGDGATGFGGTATTAIADVDVIFSVVEDEHADAAKSARTRRL